MLGFKDHCFLFTIMSNLLLFSVIGIFYLSIIFFISRKSFLKISFISCLIICLLSSLLPCIAYIYDSSFKVFVKFYNVISHMFLLTGCLLFMSNIFPLLFICLLISDWLLGIVNLVLIAGFFLIIFTILRTLFWDGAKFDLFEACL